MFEELIKRDPLVWKSIKKEIVRQREHVELIASENFTSLDVMQACGTPLTNKYAEGYPHARWYGGCGFVDEVEDIARNRVCELFNAEHANVQPHSGTQANMAVLMAMLQSKDTILAMDLAAGGHLSHGHPLNFSGKYFNVISYGVDRTSECLNYDEIASLAKMHRPKLIVAGASAYPREINFKKFREICDEVGAYLMVDMAHFAGLVAAGIHPNPCEFAEFVTSTTHKTLRGPRGGFILCKKEFAKKIDTAVFPGIQGGPLMHIIAAKAVGFGNALTPEFKQYQKMIVKNAAQFARAMQNLGYRVVSGGTDNHLFLVDLQAQQISGREAAHVLEKVNITVNKNLIPFDPQPPMVTSGIRIGTPAITARGVMAEAVDELAGFVNHAIQNRDNESALSALQTTVKDFIIRYPLYPEIED